VVLMRRYSPICTAHSMCAGMLISGVIWLQVFFSPCYAGCVEDPFIKVRYLSALPTGPGRYLVRWRGRD